MKNLLTKSNVRNFNSLSASLFKEDISLNHV